LIDTSLSSVVFPRGPKLLCIVRVEEVDLSQACYIGLIIIFILFSQDQYVYCHEVLADYVDKFKNYANFE